MRRELLLAEPVPHPLLCSLPTPLLRALLRETPSAFRALLWGRRGAAPASGAALLDRVASLCLEDEQRRLVALAETTPRRFAAHRAARLSRVLRRLLDGGHDATRLFVTSVPIHDEARLADVPRGAALIRLQREVEEANSSFAEGSAGARVRLRRSVFALVRAARGVLAERDRRRPGRVAFSARAPLVPDPSLRLDQCRLPSSLASELFLLQTPDPLHPIFLSAGEGLSRHCVQAYFPVFSSEDAVGLSPMAIRRLAGDAEIRSVKVYLPLGERAQEDACQRMMSPATVIEPGSARRRLGLSADAQLGLYLASIERTGQKGGGPFASVAEVRFAIEAGELSIHAPVVVRRGSRRLSTVAGRCLLMELFPPELPGELANTQLDAKAIERIFQAGVEVLGAPRTAKLAEEAEALGLRLVTERGVSLCLDDLVVPASKPEVLRAGGESVKAVLALYEDGMITDGERYHKILDIWSDTAEVVASDAWRAIRALPANPLYQLASSGIRGIRQEMRALAAMKGTVAKPSGEVIERPVLENLREGLSPHSFFMTASSAHAKRLQDGYRAREDRRLARALFEALGDTRITERDCGALGALPTRALVDHGDAIESLADRVRGRVLDSGRMLSPEELARLDDDEPGAIAVRSPVFCEAKGGICATCYGIDPATGALPAPDAPVGLDAAHALASALPSIGTRTFHIGGCVRYHASFVETHERGVVVVDPCDDAAIAVLPDGTRVVMAPSVEIGVRDDQGFTTWCGSARRGATLGVAPGERLTAARVLADWETYSIPLLAEHDGTVCWLDVVDGITLHERLDEVTGLTSLIVDEPKGAARSPQLSIVGGDGAVRQVLSLEEHPVLLVRDGERVHRGMVVAKRPVDIQPAAFLETHRPGLLDLFRARTERPAVVCEIAGVARVRREADRSLTVTVTPHDPGPVVVHHLPRGEYPCVQDGDAVWPGEAIVGGDLDPQDVARIFGPEDAAIRIVAHLQTVYANFGVRLDARHAELVARAMLRWVRITSAGDGPWAQGELVDRGRFDRARETLEGEGRVPPSGFVTLAALGVRGSN